MDDTAKTIRDLLRLRDQRSKAATVIEVTDAQWRALIRRRKAQGASLRQIADEAGASYQTIANISKETP